MSKKPGRNEPCPCGSGRKYKKCCGYDRSGDVNPAESIFFRDEDMTGTPLDEYMALLPFLALHEQKIVQFEPDGPELKKARNRYEKRYRPGEEGGGLDSHFVSWLYFDLRFGKSRKTIVERFLDDPVSAKLEEPGPTCLRDMAASYATFYEVLDDDSDIVILDELGTGRRWNVYYCRELFPIPPGKGEVWFTRLLGPAKRSLSYPTPYVYEPETRAQFKRAVDRIVRDFLKNKLSAGVPAELLFAESQKESALYWAEYMHIASKDQAERLSSVPSEWPDSSLPHIINADREDFVITEMHFRVKDEQAVRKKLAKLKSFTYDKNDDSWSWLKAPSRRFPDDPRTSLAHFRFKDDRLVTETNSRERAARLEAKLMGHLPGLLILDKTLYRQVDDPLPISPEELEKQRRETDELNTRPEVQEAIRQFLEKHYFEKWPHEKIPALGNKTPIQAAKTEDGRRRLADLIDYYDRIQDSDRSPQPEVDFDKLRRMFGLPTKGK